MKHKAFSLLEIMVVVAIIGLLTGIAVPTFNGIRIKQDFQEEATHIADVLADARGNAISSKQCTLSDDSKVQSKAWAMRVNNEGGGDYTLQLLCQEYKDNDSNGDLDFLPQSATGHTGTEFTRDLSSGGKIDSINIIALNLGTNSDDDNSYKFEEFQNNSSQQEAIDSYASSYNFRSFDIVYTDLSEEVYTVINEPTENYLAENYGTVSFIGLENIELDISSNRNNPIITNNIAEEFNFFQPYGICLDTRKGFTKLGCEGIYTIVTD